MRAPDRFAGLVPAPSPHRPQAPPSVGRLFSRALRLRCPFCGGRPIVLRWFSLVDCCPSCGLHLGRDEPGYWVGSYTVNIFLTEGVLAATLALGMLLTWPAVPWGLLSGVCITLALVVPALVFPFTKLFYLAIDLAFRPVEPNDLEVPHERGLMNKGARELGTGER
ncbi:MAG: hypothetical protein ACRENB_11680 [Gemmatimonadales bacterium]